MESTIATSLDEILQVLFTLLLVFFFLGMIAPKTTLFFLKKRTRLNVFIVSLIGLVTIISIVIAKSELFPDTQSKKNTSTIEEIQTTYKENQKLFCEVIEKYKKLYEDENKNDHPLNKKERLNTLINNRNLEIQKIIGKDGQINGWQGKLSHLSEHSEGKGGASITIDLHCNVKLSTTIAFIIPKNSQPYKALLNLKEGSHIFFSGNFISQNRQDKPFYEKSVSLDGYINEPTFGFDFKGIYINDASNSNEAKPQYKDIITAITDAIETTGNYSVSVWTLDKKWATPESKPPFKVLINTQLGYIDSCFDAKVKLLDIMKSVYTNPELKKYVAQIKFMPVPEFTASMGVNDSNISWESIGPSMFWKSLYSHIPYEADHLPPENQTWGKKINPQCN